MDNKYKFYPLYCIVCIFNGMHANDSLLHVFLFSIFIFLFMVYMVKVSSKDPLMVDLKVIGLINNAKRK